MERLRSIISGFLEPAECALCSGFAEPHVRVCDSCVRHIAQARRLVLPFAGGRGVPSVSRVHALGPYSGVLERAVIALKRGCPGSLTSMLASHMREALGTAAATYTVVTWVPGSRERTRKEGFDHGRVLARAIAAALGADCRQLVRRDPRARVQHGLDAGDRLTNASVAFKTHRPWPFPVAAPGARGRVLVVDDVMTTGASLEACVRLLTTGTDIQVDAAVLARADRELVC